MTKNLNKEYKKDTLIENYEKILIAMMPIIPHFSNECLKLLNKSKFEWPNFDESILKEENINIVIQINGKKRGLIVTKPGVTEQALFDIVNKDKTINKYFIGNELKKKIYIKDKLMNIII